MVTATAPVTPPSTPLSAGERHETASLSISSPERLVYGRKHINPDGVFSLVLNRPREHNALSREMLLQMEEVLDDLSGSVALPQMGRRPSHFDTPPSSTNSLRSTRDSSPAGVKDGQEHVQPVPASTAITPSPLRALIIESSSPGKFCAGADLKERKAMTEEQVVAFLQLLRRVFDKVAAFPAPTIAALDGPTLGGGLELAIACDFRVANRTVTRIGFPESGLGIIPGAGGTQRAPRLLGLTKAKELIYTGRALSATEALEWGLVDYLTDELPEADTDTSAESGGEEQQQQQYTATPQSAPARSLLLAGTMSNSAPLALRAAKLSISKGAEMELDDALKWEVQCYEDLLPTQDRREALEAFAEKRKPNFVGA